MWSTAPSPPWCPSANGRMKSGPDWAAAARGPCWKDATRSLPNSPWASAGRTPPSLRKRGCASGVPAVPPCWTSRARATSWKEEWPFCTRGRNTTLPEWRTNSAITCASPNPPSLPAPACWNATSIPWPLAWPCITAFSLTKECSPCRTSRTPLPKNTWAAATEGTPCISSPAGTTATRPSRTIRP